ncbi:hypothetical protein GE061_017013 [Apolygus lucorum]|uniref:Ionotropic glutamate receptor C-terminal domain-containing protein n=1 Tax=Apolygus lucorum TaxID=248454 RepID=A0A8S9XLU0_APOLU|nr:hypothetical protein GE061_017013 [Apolygus lucorum]
MRIVACHRSIHIVLEFFKGRDINSINAILCDNRDPAEINKNHFLAVTSVANYGTKSIYHQAIGFSSQHYQIGVIVDLGCSHSWNLLKMVSENHFFNGSFTFALIVDGFEDEKKVLDSFEPLNVAFDSEITLFLNNKLYNVYRTAKGERLISSKIGEWNLEDGLTVSPRPPRWDLRGVTLKAETVLKEFKKEMVGKNEFFDSNYFASVDVLSRLAVKRHTYAEYLLNFRTNLSVTPDWGYYNELTGSFDRDSMYGELEHATTEFGLTESWMYSTRINAGFFAPVTHFLTSCVVFRHPAAGASFTAFARPFAWTTWLVTFLFVVIGSASLNIIRRHVWEDEPPNEPQFSSSFLQVAGVMCLQGSYISSIKIPTRILSIFLQIMALLVYTYYGAEILGYLLSPTPRTITTVDKLMDSHMDLWAENVSFHRSHFKGLVSAKATKYYNLAIKKSTPDQDRFIDRAIGLRLVQQGGTALYGVTWSFYENIPLTYSSSEICSLYYMELLHIKTAVAVQKRSPYREMYFRAIQRVLESGLNDLELRRWNAPKPQCLGSEGNSAVKLEATFIALMIYSIGFVSDKLLMNTSYVYALIFDVTIQTALKQLEPLNIQFDSDITVFTRYFEMYDLFRTSIERPLTAVKCGGWNEKQEINYLKPARWDLDGITINATTVVKAFNWNDGIRKFLDSKYYPEIDSLSRFAVVTHNYTEYLCNFKTSVLFRHPPAGATYDGFARPFSLTTWLVTFLFVFVSSLVLKAIRHNQVVDEPPNEPEYSFSIFTVLAVLSLQGSYVDSLRIPTRVLSVILHFFGLMVYSYYGAEVVGFLLSPSPRTLTTVEKLVASPLDCWTENLSYHLNHFESKINMKITKYYEMAIKGPTRDKDKFMDREKALEKVKKGGFALYGTSDPMFKIIQSSFTGPEICSLYVMDMMSVPVAVAIRKKSPYREMYTKAILRFAESGLRDYEDKKWHSEKPACFGSEDTEPVKLEATFIAQMIFVGGFLLSVMCFIIEIAVAKKMKKPLKQTALNVSLEENEDETKSNIQIEVTDMEFYD